MPLEASLLTEIIKWKQLDLISLIPCFLEQNGEALGINKKEHLWMGPAV